MSHEIRTPLHGILGTASLILGTELTTAQRTYTETIKQSGDALFSLINSILDLSKIEADNLTLEKVDFRLRQVLDGVSSLTGSPAQHKGLALEIVCAPDVDVILKGDPGRIRQILLNLIGNATKFTETAQIDVWVSQKRDQGKQRELVFEVSDTGIGLSNEQQEHVFDRFAQANGLITRKYGGTGLGLAICKEPAELMGEGIGVRSEFGKGSTFWFTICCELGDEENIDEQLEGIYVNDSIEAGDFRPLHILIAEDNPVNQLIATDTLTTVGHNVDVVSNGLEALEAVSAKPYDVILMDVFMPDMDGITAAQKIREMPGEISSIPIIALTADAMAGGRE